MKTVASSRCILVALTPIRVSTSIKEDSQTKTYISTYSRVRSRQWMSTGNHGMIDGWFTDIISGDEVTHARAHAVTRADVVTRWTLGVESRV